MKELCDKGLQFNTKLRNFAFVGERIGDEDLLPIAEVLENHNKTIQSIHFAPEDDQSIVAKRIRHYLKMNQYGRGRVGMSDFTVEELTLLLGASKECSAELNNFTLFTEQFNLLSASVGLWSNKTRETGLEEE